MDVKRKESIDVPLTTGSDARSLTSGRHSVACLAQEDNVLVSETVEQIAEVRIVKLAKRFRCLFDQRRQRRATTDRRKIGSVPSLPLPPATAHREGHDHANAVQP